MNEKDFPELIRINTLSVKTHKLYWIAAILFWVGFLISIHYYFSQTGTIPSMLAGALMLGGLGVYLFTYYFIKSDS